MSKKSRRNKRLSEAEIQEVEEFVWSRNVEEDKFLQTMSINTKCKTTNQKLLVNSIKQNMITICNGFPGSGKTFLSCSEALKLIKSRPKYKRIVLIKSITALKGEEIGHLPGDLKEKMDPWLAPIYHNLYMLYGKEKVDKDLFLNYESDFKKKESKVIETIHKLKEIFNNKQLK